MGKSPNDIREWVIYKITNPNGNTYIGKSHDFKRRLSNYKHINKSVHRQKIIYNSLIKYGSENHTFTVIDTFNSNLSFANGKEMFWIRTNMSNLSKWRDGKGMNLTDGGDGCIGASFPNRISHMKGKNISEKTKAFLSKYNTENPSKGMLGKNHSDETKKRMSETKKGMPSPLKGVKTSPLTVIKNRLSHIGIPNKNKGKSVWSKEDKKRIGDSKIGNTYNKGKVYTENVKLKMRFAKIKKCKPIIQYDINGVFIAEYLSSRDAAEKTKISRSAIIGMVKGLTVNPKTYSFKYK